MDRDPQKCESPASTGLDHNHNNYHVQSATAEPLLQRLDGVQKAGSGWRARCPACGGKSRKLSMALRDDKVLINCFGCGDAEAVLAAVGLRWADLMPPRHWPQSPEERRQSRRAIRECGWAAALETVAHEGVVIHLAASQLARWEPLNVEDDERLALACMRVSRAALVLTERETWRPAYCYAPARLASIKRMAVTELRRQLATAEEELTAAETALAEFNRVRGAA